MESILFYWSKGADIRRKIIQFLAQCNQKEKPCYLNHISKQVKLSHVAVKKHLDLLLEEGYIKPINPEGKPIYLQLTSKGKGVVRNLNKSN